MKKSTIDSLSLRKIKESDSGFLFRLMNSPGWLEFIGDRSIHSKDDALNYIKQSDLFNYSQSGLGYYVIINGECADQNIGICGILHREDMDAPDLGFAILPEYQGRGIAFRSVQKLVSQNQKELHNWSRILAITRPANIRSIALLKRIGFVFVETMIWQDKEVDLYQLNL